MLESSNLRKKTLLGLAWTFAQQFSTQIVNLTVQVLLARLLAPTEFGLIAMLQVFSALATTLVDGGMATSLIRMSRVGQKDYSTIFFMNLAISLLTYSILFLTASEIARFYNQPDLELIIKIYMIGIIIQALIIVQTTILNKQMNFKLQMFLQLPSLIVSGIVGIVLAYFNFGVWSLVYMYLIRSFILAAQFWTFTPWRPILYFDSKRFLKHFKFGYRLTLSAVLNTLFENSYNLIIGKYFSPIQLGYYNRAYTFRQLAVENISNALNKVTFPMFASIQNDDKKLKEVYRKVMRQVIFWIAPILILLVIIAKPLFSFILTDKWIPAVPYFQLLCIAGILYPLHAYNLNVLNVKGRSDLFLRLEVVKKIFIACGLLVAVRFGIYGLISFQIISSITAFFINTYYSGKLLDYSSLKQLKDIFPAILCAACVGLLLYYCNFLILPHLSSNLLLILIDSTVYITIYIALAFIFKMPAISDLQLILKK